MATTLDSDYLKSLSTTNSALYNSLADQYDADNASSPITDYSSWLKGLSTTNSGLYNDLANQYDTDNATTTTQSATTTPTTDTTTGTTYTPQTYTATDYTAAQNLASQTPTDYTPYDYSSLLTAANATPSTYDTFDYSKSADLATNDTQVSDLGNDLSISDVNDQIAKAANTLSTADYQSPEYSANATASIMEAMSPTLATQNIATNQNYANSAKKLSELMAASGLGRSGANLTNATSIEQSRNNELDTNYSTLLTNAMNQAIEQGQLGLAEKTQLQSQQQTAADQLADLLNTQESSKEWAADTNLDTAQNNFANTLAYQTAQADENQLGANYDAEQVQNQFENLATANELAAGENQYGQQFTADQLQNQFTNTLATTEAQAEENQFGSSFAASEAGKAVAANQWTTQFTADEAQRVVENDLAAQQFAEQVKQNAATNKNNAISQVTGLIEALGIEADAVGLPDSFLSGEIWNLLSDATGVDFVGNEEEDTTDNADTGTEADTGDTDDGETSSSIKASLYDNGLKSTSTFAQLLVKEYNNTLTDEESTQLATDKSDYLSVSGHTSFWKDW